MSRQPARYWHALLASLPFLLALRPSAAVPCDNVALPNKVFGTGGSTITSRLKRVALAIANDAEGTPAAQTTIFYSDLKACDGYGDFLTGKSTRVFKYWVAGQTADQTCEAREGGQPLDFAYLQLDSSYCGAGALPVGVCGCRFEAVAHGVATCSACVSDEDCAGAAPSCNFGYCEAYREAGASEG